MIKMICYRCEGRIWGKALIDDGYSEKMTHEAATTKLYWQHIKTQNRYRKLIGYVIIFMHQLSGLSTQNTPSPKYTSGSTW